MTILGKIFFDGVAKHIHIWQNNKRAGSAFFLYYYMHPIIYAVNQKITECSPRHLARCWIGTARCHYPNLQYSTNELCILKWCCEKIFENFSHNVSPNTNLFWIKVFFRIMLWKTLVKYLGQTFSHFRY